MSTSYDAVLYLSYAFQQTHPARIAALARLHDVPATSPTKCRVLELGCGNGANLLPMAATYPDSEFVGLDLAPTVIETARKAATDLGLRNVSLYAADIREADDSLGRFDYIIAHGVFSWVPEDVRLAMLDLCGRLLTPHGVAYISYNAYPGCYVRRAFWDVLKFHTRTLTDPAQKVQQAKAVLHFLAEGTAFKGPLCDAVRQEARAMAFDRHESVLFHDDLAGINQPYYFHEFAALAAGHGLRFLSEADYSDMTNTPFPQAVTERLLQLGQMDVHLQEQYRDYLTMRRFRQTLLVRADVAIDRPPDPWRVKELSIACETRPDPADADLSPGVPVQFQLKSGTSLTIDHPLAKAALLALGRRWPHPISFAELLPRAAEILGRAERDWTPREEEVVAEVLLAAFGTGMLHFYVDPPRTAAAPGDRPRVSQYARHQLTAGDRAVTNLMHVPVKVEEDVIRWLLESMDGTRDRVAVVDELTRRAVAESAEQPAGDEPKPTEAELRAHFAGQIDAGFAKAAELALVEA